MVNGVLSKVKRINHSVMAISDSTSVIRILLLLYCFCIGFCDAIDTITSTQFIKDPESIVANGSAFRLGFFSPDGSTNRYVGIWYYNTSLLTVVWVANRDKPLNDSSGILTISEDGNLLVMNGKKEIFWSTDVTNASLNSSARLLDSGNLVLQDKVGGNIIWESFQHPSNSFMQYMKLTSNMKTGEKQLLTAWKNPSDPAVGSFSAGLAPSSFPEFFVWNGSRPYWRSGPSNGQIFIGIPDMNSFILYGYKIINDQGEVSMSFSTDYVSMLWYFILTPQGILLQIQNVNGLENWGATWSSQETECDVYGKCGAFGICDSKNSQICSCLRGYEPKYIEEWSRGNWTGGCVRKTPLQRERTNGSGEDGKKDGFIRITTVKVPDFSEWLPVLEDQCGDECLKNFSCIAYAYYTGIGCMSWSSSLIDVQKFSTGGTDLYVRVAHSELDKKGHMKVIVAITVIIGTITVALCIYFSRRCVAKQRAKKKSEEMLPLDRVRPQYSDTTIVEENVSQVKFEELPLLDFQKLLSATNNFHEANKLGKGGFGPVYRGRLSGGQEIAVKRLSRASVQGQEEFMNEVVVISKLQHRNLVRLLGCCVEGDEKMLVYEYMPNKSLDAFLFDPVKKEALDWRKRFNIIEGIGRGLLYLHRDSRLRIIHRDLKASNILLDEELNPKISDFGMARIFGQNQVHGDTIRVAGTYGYISPEYAIEGRFSEKSDVFSFGVLLLEIVSGRKNGSFYHEDSLSLLGYTWKLWNEEKIEALIDGSISETYFKEEILRCIQVGLLCVQEYAKDRPSISTVVGMLCSEIVHLPPPKQPAFIERLSGTDTEPSRLFPEKYSVDRAAITVIRGR